MNERQFLSEVDLVHAESQRDAMSKATPRSDSFALSISKPPIFEIVVPPAVQSRGATAALASAEVTTGMTSKSVMSFQFAIH